MNSFFKLLLICLILTSLFPVLLEKNQPLLYFRKCLILRQFLKSNNKQTGGKMTFLQAGQNQVNFDDQYGDFQTDTSSIESTFVSESPVMQVVYDKIQELARSSSPVLILGAKGTGRTAVAREIFNSTDKTSSKRFAKFVCYGLSPAMIESQLFGNAKNSGLLSRGKDSTLFIKGIECLDSFLQNKLLSYLSDYKNKDQLSRLIFSAEENLSKKVKEDEFSQELFEVLSHNLLILPSLSERKEDIPYLISLFNKQNNFKGHISDNALELLKSLTWKENIKELKNVCLQVSILYTDKDFIDEEDLSMIINKKSQPVEELMKYDPNLLLEDIVNGYIQLSLNHFQSKKDSAKALGVSVKTIYNKIKTGCVVFSE